MLILNCFIRVVSPLLQEKYHYLTLTQVHMIPAEMVHLVTITLSQSRINVLV